MSLLWWLLKKLLRVTLDLIIVLVVFALLPGIPPHVPFTNIEELEPSLPLEGALARNNILDNAERVLDGKIVGPESIASRKREEIFVSLHGGKILRIWGPRYDHYKIVTSIGPGCEAPWEEEVCGRPLGLRFAPDGRLLVADAYLGLFAVDVETGEKEELFDIYQEIEGVVPRIADDLDVDQDGYIYWSDASSHAGLNKGVIEILASPSGRLIKFNPKTKTNTVLVKNLQFANGVQLSPDQNYVLVCESIKNRVHRHWLRGPRAGETEIFVERLPGMPDNIRSNGHGGYYVSLISINSEASHNLRTVLIKLPVLRKLITRLMYVTRVLLEAIGTLDSSHFIEEIANKILHLEPISDLMLKSNLSIVAEVDGSGSIIGSLQGDSGKQVKISETHRNGDYMFFGSPYNKYLGKLLVGSPPSMEVEGKGVRMKTEKDVVGGSMEVEEQGERMKPEKDVVGGNMEGERMKTEKDVVEGSMEVDLRERKVILDRLEAETIREKGGLKKEEKREKETIDQKKVIEKENTTQEKSVNLSTLERETTEEESEKVEEPDKEKVESQKEEDHSEGASQRDEL